MLAFVLLAISFIFFVPVFRAYLDTGRVDRIPTLIVCGFTTLAAIQSFFTGMTLDTIKQRHRQELEMDLIRVNTERNDDRNR